MNFYCIEKADEKKTPELLSSIKQFLKERLSGAIEDPVLQLAYGGNNPFFLKTQAGILWVRMFEEALTLRDIPALRHDLERVSQMFRQKVRFYIFAPGYGENFSMTASHPQAESECFRHARGNLNFPSSQEMLFFEYFSLRSRFGQAVALRECKIRFSAQALPDTAQEKAPSLPGSFPGQLRNVRLEKEELSELISLSLDLKGLGSAASSASY
ncbi:MAG TPA: hypothetical protein VJC08_01525 [bacterium]|nr:hypothetical protein [bacterium]